MKKVLYGEGYQADLVSGNVTLTLDNREIILNWTDGLENFRILRKT